MRARAKARLLREGWKYYFEPYGIPRELYDEGCIREVRGMVTCQIDFKRQDDSGVTLRLSSVYYSKKNGAILQADACLA